MAGHWLHFSLLAAVLLWYGIPLLWRGSARSDYSRHTQAGAFLLIALVLACHLGAHNMLLDGAGHGSGEHPCCLAQLPSAAPVRLERPPVMAVVRYVSEQRVFAPVAEVSAGLEIRGPPKWKNALVSSIS